MTVDLTFSSSPLVPALPLVHWVAAGGNQYFHYPALTSMETSILYSFGDSIDYRSVQAGSPQGLEIVPVSGHMIWNTEHVTPGDYSVQVVTKDIETGLRVAAELRLHLSSSNLQPYFPHISNPLPPDITYVSPGQTTNTTFAVLNGHSVAFSTSQPQGLTASISNTTLLGKWYINL